MTQFLNKPLLDQYNNFGGVRIEDTILITDTGYEVLSNAPKDIESISDLRQK